MVGRKRRSGLFGFGGWPFGEEDEDVFDDLPGFGFGQMDEIMNKMLEDMQKNQAHLQSTGEPIVYGVNIRIGPDGKPHVSRFGNVAKGTVKEEREPLIDVINHAREIRVIAEVPGVDKNNIKLKTTVDSLAITINDPNGKFAKTLKLPEPVLDKSAKATYKNGILEVILQKQKPSEKKEIATNVKID